MTDALDRIGRAVAEGAAVALERRALARAAMIGDAAELAINARIAQALRESAAEALADDGQAHSNTNPAEGRP